MRATCFALTLMAAAPNTQASPDDFGDTVVYGVHRALDLGGKGERPKTDYFINMGARSGVVKGDIIEARRNTPSYDLLNRRLYKDMSYPIARMRIIHVERSMAVARLLRMLPADETPSITPAAVMIGDSVRRLAPDEIKKELLLSRRVVQKKRGLASVAKTAAPPAAAVQLGDKASPSAPIPPGTSPAEGNKTSPSVPTAAN